ncbi:hypothetical protein GCM10025789_01950 [Tessaracoccus lubricantis]|uniref:HNH nuclease domain-containing protein n=1 Tax=Tessaracoccus lubricantis TaxID=545543 RepID=A0ABP9EX93_9ACTN
MNETVELLQRAMAALWDSAASLSPDGARRPERLRLVELIAETKAQLAGLELHLLEDAWTSGDLMTVEGVRNSVRANTGQSRAAFKLALDLGGRFPLIAAALRDGTVSLEQVQAIVHALRKLPVSLGRAEVEKCQESILRHAHELGPDELRALSVKLYEMVDPDGAEADEKKKLEAQDRRAMRNRFLRITPDHHGGMKITGLLPVARAELLRAQLEAVEPPLSSYREADELPDKEMRRADAFMLLIQTAAATGNLPAHGGDRPQVHITLDYHTLITGLGKAGIIGAENLDGLSAGDARRLACDADIIPAVLGSDSRPLDVARAHRMFPAAIRTALILRDGGCAFPGCTTTPRACEAHHIVPWWADGLTCLGNAVLLCPHHHRLVEPDPDQSPESQWHVHLDPDTGLPWFTPPTHIDPGRTPKLHRRFQLRTIRYEHSPDQPPGRNRDGSQRRPPRRHNLGRRLPRGLTAPTQAPPRPTPQPPPQQSESSPAWRYQE